MRAIVAALAGLIGAAGVATAQQPAAGRVTYATETVSFDNVRIAAAPRGSHVLIGHEQGTILLDSATVKEASTFDATHTVEFVPTAGSIQRDIPVLVRRMADGQQVSDPFGVGPPIRIGLSDVVILAVTTADGLTIATHDGRDEANSATRTLRIHRSGREAPLAVVELRVTPQRSNEVRVAVSADGRRFAYVWDGTAALVDLSTGAVRPVQLGERNTAINAIAFTADGARALLLTNDGPLLWLDTDDLTVSTAIEPPKLTKRFDTAVHRGGAVIEIESRRQRAFIDAATGKHVLAERGSSTNGFLLQFVAPDLLVRAYRGRMGKVALYGAYRHAAGAFKQLYKQELEGLVLGTLQVSPNGACLFYATTQRAEVRTVATNALLAKAAETHAPLSSAVFAADGRRVIAVDEAGGLLTIDAPVACHGVTRD